MKRFNEFLLPHNIEHILINMHLSVCLEKIDWFQNAGKTSNISSLCIHPALLSRIEAFRGLRYCLTACKAKAGKLQAIQKITCPAAIILRCTKVLLKGRKSAGWGQRRGRGLSAGWEGALPATGTE